MKRTGVVLLVLLGIIVVVGMLVFGSYISARNQMVAKNEEVKQTWSQVDVVMQRRADLIPNLVSTVQGYASHETTVFGEIANARAALLGARNPQDKIAANGQLDNALGHLLMISEAYPDLKSNQNFLQLQDELAGTENRIAVERRRYNQALQDYNTFIGLFPNSIWAGIAGYHRNNAYFEGTPASQQVPTVNFNGK
ncbi:MAG TPA: LemA family protein [Acidobacteriaceae bacterium]